MNYWIAHFETNAYDHVTYATVSIYYFKLSSSARPRDKGYQSPGKLPRNPAPTAKLCAQSTTFASPRVELGWEVWGKAAVANCSSVLVHMLESQTPKHMLGSQVLEYSLVLVHKLECHTLLKLSTLELKPQTPKRMLVLGYSLVMVHKLESHTLLKLSTLVPERQTPKHMLGSQVLEHSLVMVHKLESHAFPKLSTLVLEPQPHRQLKIERCMFYATISLTKCKCLVARHREVAPD
ncbi:LOW QUALITY PROTEIN: hypothetical protein Cgig2_000416 [Carnegiea gigantea]|uniref:Uncharacterized protein n=1 Tax=Carnegiea gigantea TaxID=171969 RepID=A0A9Q1GGW1_9CARY|nr:LOW QUALITY PROTEIN: hypothetical protein Cgig2_000416 [Carnegiea gigantea]